MYEHVFENWSQQECKRGIAPFNFFFFFDTISSFGCQDLNIWFTGQVFWQAFAIGESACILKALRVLSVQRIVLNSQLEAGGGAGGEMGERQMETRVKTGELKHYASQHESVFCGNTEVLSGFSGILF